MVQGDWLPLTMQRRIDIITSVVYFYFARTDVVVWIELRIIFTNALIATKGDLTLMTLQGPIFVEVTNVLLCNRI